MIFFRVLHSKTKKNRSYVKKSNYGKGNFGIEILMAEYLICENLLNNLLKEEGLQNLCYILTKICFDTQ